MLVARSALADEPVRPEDTLAQTLFDEAVALMNDGKVDEACPKLAESQRLAPAGGTILNLAFCLERQHKYASAYTAYREAIGSAIRENRKDRETSARERLAIVLPLLSRVVVHVSEKARIPDLEVRFDGTPVREAAWDIAAPVDPGRHEIIATAPNKKAFKKTIEITTDGSLEDVTVPAFEDEAPKIVLPPKKPIVETPKPIEEKPNRMPVWISGGVTAAFLAFGIGTSIAAGVKHGEFDKSCRMVRCPESSYAPEDQASALAAASNVGFVLAAGGAIATVVLFFVTNPKKRDTTAWSPELRF